MRLPFDLKKVRKDKKEMQMVNLIEIGGVEIHKDVQGRYCLNDLHRAAGGERRHSPSLWLENQQTQDLAQELSDTGIPVSVIKGGLNQGTFVCKELVYAYAMWISAKFHLQVIRTFDALAKGKPTNKSTETLEATKLFRPFFQIARMIGCDKSSAAISANQAVQAVSGTNMLALMGQAHLEAENQDALFFNPTELGARIGVSARKLNLLLAEAGFQSKRGEVWEVMEAGKEFARIYDTGKRHGSGVPVQQIKWAASVMSMLKQGEEA